MKDESLRRKLLVKQMMETVGDSLEQLVEQLLEEIARLQSELDRMNSCAPPIPITEPNQRRILLDDAIKKAAFQMHRAFNACQVPNAIHAKVSFPEGLYEIRFTRLKTPNFE